MLDRLSCKSEYTQALTTLTLAISQMEKNRQKAFETVKACIETLPVMLPILPDSFQELLKTNLASPLKMLSQMVMHCLFDVSSLTSHQQFLFSYFLNTILLLSTKNSSIQHFLQFQTAVDRCRITSAIYQHF